MVEYEECNIENEDEPGYQDDISHLPPLNLLPRYSTLVTAVLLLQICRSAADCTVSVFWNGRRLVALILRQVLLPEPLLQRLLRK